MAIVINREEAPGHISNIRELDFSADLFVKRLDGPWFRLGAQTLRERRDAQGIDDAVSRQSLLLAPGGFKEVFDKLESVGNVLHNLGSPDSYVREGRGGKQYGYAPFHQFELHFASVVAEPLAFLRSDTSGVRFFINPDLWMYLELEQRTPGSGIWWDPRRGADALIHHVIDEGHLEVVDIRTGYLLKYLQARQMSLIVGHFRHLLLFDPPSELIARFVKEDVTLGSPEQGAKAILQNWGLNRGVIDSTQYLQRRLHLWFEITPPEINIDDPWADSPPFDTHAFTLPTHAGPVAPARWKHLRRDDGNPFEGTTCDFMNRVYFRQEVLSKYEGVAGCDVKDDGSVSCRHYWGLVRSTSRLGNELLSTAIGDFAEGIPFEEWPHWKQYAVEPPSAAISKTLTQEPKIPEAVNVVVDALKSLSANFTDLGAALGITLTDPLWRGSIDSLAGRQLKWVYPATADDSEFLKRATLASTLFLDGLLPAPLRHLLGAVGANLHQTFENSPKSLGSRNLLQRVALIASLVERLHPDVAELPGLVQQAEGKAQNTVPDLQVELKATFERVREEFAPLAFLYDLRVHGGLAHPPNQEQAAVAASQLGLPRKHWHRKDYLCLLHLITEGLNRISEHFEAAIWALEE